MLPGSRSPESREARQKSACRPMTGPMIAGAAAGSSDPSPSMKARTVASSRAAADSDGARPPIAAARLDDHARARGGGDFGRPVARAAVDDQNLVDAEREKLPHQRADRGRLVEAGRDRR